MGELGGRKGRNDVIISQSQKINNVSFKMSFKCLCIFKNSGTDLFI